MDINRMRDKLESSVGALLEENNLTYFWNVYLFRKEETAPEDYNDNLRSFKFLFARGGDSHIYLWNNLFRDFAGFSTTELDRDDFSSGELLFLENIESTYKQVAEKYGEYFSAKQNINTPIETQRLKLCPFSSQLNVDYIDFFENNRNEFESYYNKEYDADDISNMLRNCNQESRKLSFAIILKETEQFAGSVALEMKRNDVVYNIEYYLFPEFRKHGYAREAVAAIIDAARKRKLLILQETIKDGIFDIVPADIRCIEALIKTTNPSSIKLVKDLGFVQYGIIPYEHYYNGQYYDDYSFEMLIGK